MGRLLSDDAVASYFGKVTHPLQQTDGDARRAPRTAGDLGRPVELQVNTENAGGPDQDGLQLLGLVIVVVGNKAEAIPQRAGNEAGASGGADQGEEIGSASCRERGG